MRVLHPKEWGATYRAHNVTMLRLMEEEWNPIELNNWDSNTISGWLNDRVGGRQLQLVTFAPIRDKVLWEGKKTVIHRGLFPVGGKIPPSVI